MTVFDGEDELYKIASLKDCKKLKLLLRLTTDDKDSVCRFSKKFGCPAQEANALLVVAQQLGLNVAGVSFHVGSGCGAAYAYTEALQDARDVFKMAENLGMPPMTIVDIGGGFPGDDTIYGTDRLPNFQDLAKAIRQGIADLLKSLRRPATDIRYNTSSNTVNPECTTDNALHYYNKNAGQLLVWNSIWLWSEYQTIQQSDNFGLSNTKQLVASILSKIFLCLRMLM